MKDSVVEQAGANSMGRTPVPSDLEHARTLFSRHVRKDMQKPKLYAAKFLLMPLMLMLYCIGFLLQADGLSDEPAVIVGNLELFQGTSWNYPQAIRLAAEDDTLLQSVEENLQDLLQGESVDIVVESLLESNRTAFLEGCQDALVDTFASGEVCVILEDVQSLSIFFGGKEDASPFQSALAATQWAVSNALITASTGDTVLAYPVDKIQRTPRLVQASEYEPPLILILLPGVMHVLACAVAAQFMIGPITYEKINHVTESFLFVGVKMRTYLMTWVVYYSMNLLPTAVILTLVSEYWNLMPMSSPVLIGTSHYLGLVHMISQFTLIMQFISQEELAQGLPFLYGICSIAIGTGLIYIEWTTSVLVYILSLFSPFVGIMQYYAIYATYDYAGFDTGIQRSQSNVAESGLLGNYMAQVGGIVLTWILIGLYSSESFVDWLLGRHSQASQEERMATEESSNNALSGEAFEPLPPNADVLVRVRGLTHTYYPSRLACDKSQRETLVLKGLDMDICRGEVFGYLGHNGAGKTTSVGILADQIKLQNGNVTYHFRDGDFDLSSSKDVHSIRRKIGVCPQHNTSLQEDLTAREHLRLFALLKGNIAQAQGQSVMEAVEAEVEERLRDVKFTSIGDADKPIGTYSGGMKRKVLIAMALLGDPEVVVLDEPTAGLDPYNRRSIWDMIVEAKQGRSIILTTHFLDEADVLSDRVGIIKNGQLITCGSSLFLKHASDVGYTLTFDASAPIALDSEIDLAEAVEVDIGSGTFKWRLGHGTENKFPQALKMLKSRGASNIQLDLTTLEEVFLETGREDHAELELNDADTEEYPVEIDGNDDFLENPPAHDLEANTNEFISRIWEPRCSIAPVSWVRKLMLIKTFMMVNAWKMKGTIMLNVTMPLLYLIIGVMLSEFVVTELDTKVIINDQIPITPGLIGQSAYFFGEDSVVNNTIAPLIPIDAPKTIEEYHQPDDFKYLGGYYEQNATLQYAREMTPFALQVVSGVLANFSAWESGGEGISVTVQQLPYESEIPFRSELLFIPFCISFGFAGLAFSVLDVLLLKGHHIIGLFRVVGITEWTTYLGVMMYKCQTSFLPFFVLLLVLSFSFGLVIVGDSGRWLGTLLLLLSYAFSSTPMGLILAKRFIHSDFKSVANWFPGVYFTFSGIPYIVYSSLLQALPEKEQTILIVGDVLSLIPQVAFQRGLGAIIELSSDYRDEDLAWGDVWNFKQRVWFTILIMCIVGTIEWIYLYQLTTTRAKQSELPVEEKEALITPIDISEDPLIVEERARSHADADGINARDIVKVFYDSAKGNAAAVTKKSVKGVSFGIRQNEILALLGPNGAGKTCTMSALAGEITPENGSVALNGITVTPGDRSVDPLFKNGKVSYVPQFDALFPNQTVQEHLKFYAQIRGLDWEMIDTQAHVEAIVKLLGLGKHRDKTSDQLSGGYKRRLSLAVALIGYPEALMLDEVTTGLDPGARRLIWNVLKPPRQPASMNIPAILLSTHYMEESETLGDRIAIMVDGKFVATGTLQQLYEKYCTSYFVELSLLPEADTNVILEALPDDATIYESLPHHVKLQVPLHGDPIDQLADLFELLETNKNAFKIQFYSIAKMNLEQIFIHLSRQQFESNEEFEAQQQQLSG